MKAVRNFFAGMTVMAMALSFAACGAAENTDNVDTQLAAVSPSAVQTAADLSDESAEYPEIRALLDALRNDDFEAYTAAIGDMDTYINFEIQMNKFYAEQFGGDTAVSYWDELTDEDKQLEWESFVQQDYEYNVMGMNAFGDDFAFTVADLTAEELEEMGEPEEGFPAETTDKSITVTDTAGNSAEFMYEKMTLKDGRSLNYIFLWDSSDMSVQEKSAQLTANANAKTLYNAAAEVAADSEMNGTPLADGTYEYDTDGTYDDALGKNIVDIFSAVPEYKAHCTVKITDGVIEFANFDPQDGSGIVGTYPDFDEMFEDEAF